MRVIWISNYKHERSNTLRCSRNITPSGRWRPSLAEKRNETIFSKVKHCRANASANHFSIFEYKHQSCWTRWWDWRVPFSGKTCSSSWACGKGGMIQPTEESNCCFVLLGRSVCNSRWTIDYERSTEFFDYSRFLQSIRDFSFFESTGRYAFQYWYLFADIRQWFVTFRHWRTNESACSYLFR